MTLNEVIESVKGRFVILLHDDDAKLLNLAYQALRLYQDKAGFIGFRRGSADRKDDFIESVSPFAETIVSSQDATKNYYEAAMDKAQNRINFHTDGWQKYPFEASYLINKVKEIQSNPDTELPFECVSDIEELLFILISIPNNQQIRALNDVGEQPNDGMLTESELNEAKNRIIERMEQNSVLTVGLAF